LRPKSLATILKVELILRSGSSHSNDLKDTHPPGLKQTEVRTNPQQTDAIRRSDPHFVV